MLTHLESGGMDIRHSFHFHPKLHSWPDQWAH